MFRKHEDPDKFKAGALALLVHLALLGGMLISFNWKAAHQVLNVTEVELWDKLPTPKVAAPPPEPKPVIEENPEPKPEPKPVVEEKPEPKAEEKADIELEKKKKELAEKEKQLAEKQKQEEQKRQEEKKLAEQKKKEELEKLRQAMRDEDLTHKKPNKDALKKVQAEIDSENAAHEDAAKSVASASLIGEYTDKIKAKIRGNVNKTLCGDGNPELRFEIALLPTGEISGSPKLTKSSGNPVCDEAVERAIIASEPLPVPADASLFAPFRNTKLKFRPND